MPPETVTTTTPPNTPPASNLSGGPTDQIPHGAVHPDLKQTIPSATTTTQQPPKYQINGKTFNSAEDMSKYVADLERKVITNPQSTQIAQNFVYPKNDPNKELIDGKPIEDVLFENPTKVLKHLEDKVERKIEQRATQENNVKVFWAKFYEENPDLKGKEEFVQTSVQANWGRNNNWDLLSVEEFPKVVSQYARSTLKKLGLSNATEIPNNNAATLSSSGNAPAVPNLNTAEPTNFVDEMRKHRMRRKA